MDLFLFPAFQDLVRVLKAGLSRLEDRPRAGLLYDLKRKPVCFQPGIHKSDFGFHGAAVGDPHGFEDCIIVPLVTCVGLLGVGDRRDPFFGPGHGHGFDVADTAVVPAYAVFDKVFDEIGGKAQTVVEEQDLLDFRSSQGLTQILFGNIQKLDDLLVLLQFADP